MLSKKIAALAAAALITTGSAASARSADALSLAGSPAAQRAGAEMEASSELRGWRVIIVGVLLIGILVFVITELSKDNDLPNSP